VQRKEVVHRECRSPFEPRDPSRTPETDDKEKKQVGVEKQPFPLYVEVSLSM